MFEDISCYLVNFVRVLTVDLQQNMTEPALCNFDSIEESDCVPTQLSVIWSRLGLKIRGSTKWSRTWHREWVQNLVQGGQNNWHDNQQSDEQEDEAEDIGQRTQALQAFVAATRLFDTIRTTAQCSKVVSLNNLDLQNESNERYRTSTIVSSNTWIVY